MSNFCTPTATLITSDHITFEFDPGISSAVEVLPHENLLPPVVHAALRGPLSADLADRMQRYWQAANYLTVGQIYLRDNPLLRESLRPAVLAEQP